MSICSKGSTLNVYWDSLVPLNFLRVYNEYIQSNLVFAASAAFYRS